MRKGHRRTQSACILTSSEAPHKKPQQSTPQSEIIKLLQESENKVERKVITCDRLEISNEHLNKFLTFGNSSLTKFNRDIMPIKIDSKLLCIPQTNKSSQISSQPLSHSHEDEISVLEKEKQIPKRKKKPKRGSDFRRLQNIKKETSYSQLPNSARAYGEGEKDVGK